LKRDARVYYSKVNPETPTYKCVPTVPVMPSWYSGHDYISIMPNNFDKAMNHFNRVNNIFTPKVEGFQPQSKQIFTPVKESFSLNSNHDSREDLDEMYKSLLNSYIHAIYNYVSCNKLYSSFSKNWSNLKRNINKGIAGKLSENDKDIAYTENKGETIKFQFRNSQGYIPKQVYTYVCLHEITHLCFEDSFIGHDSPFPEMLCVLCVAGYELQLFDLKKISRSIYYSDGRPIASRGSIIDEILRGIKILKQRNHSSSEFYQVLAEKVKSEA
jgi:hypothetical protein